jgi:hypothetical protein
MAAMADTVRIAEFIDAFGEDPGVLPDGSVRDSTHADWQLVLDALHAVGWPMAVIDSQASPVPREVSTLLAADELPSFFACPITGVKLNFFCSREGPVLFDIDLREIVSQEALDALCEAIRLIGRSTGRNVALSHEGSELEVLTFDFSTECFELYR